MRSRFIAELTTPEVEKYLTEGGKTAFLPVGSVEMHGPHLPLGTDTIIAKGFAMLLAEGCNGLVFPEVHYGWAGSTDGFTGTVSIEPRLMQKTVEAVVLRIYRMGFCRLLVLNVHAPNRWPIPILLRQIYEKHLWPAVYVDPTVPLGEDTRPIFEGDRGKAKEASLVLASLKILGQGTLYSEKELCYDEKPPPSPESYWAINRVGTVGYFMQDMRQHACPSKHVSLERGLEFMKKQVQHILPVLEQIDRYTKDTQGLKNKGWWRAE